MKNMPSDYENLRKTLESCGQSHLLHFWTNLTETERHSLSSEIEEIDVKHCIELFKQAMSSETQKDSDSLASHMQPVPPEAWGSVMRSTPQELQELENEGLRQIAEGRVATLLLAGGQGTRLGVTYPKGMYDIGLPSHKSLYQLQAERILRLQTLAQQLTGVTATVPWYIMTSEHTREPTVQFLSDHGYFGLQSSQIFVFEQAMLPCFSFDGKILLETPSRLARAPDGNGGLFRALRDNKALEDMARRGLEFVHVYGVDNVLVRPADPVFVGYCSKQGVECGAKVVDKAFPTEAVGVICKVDECYSVVEYSELTLDLAKQRTPDGRLTYGLGSICNHIFSVPFLKRICNDFRGVSDGLKLHVARKCIPVADPDTGESKAPSKANGVKVEKFVFDAFPLAKSFACWGVLREDEFSPLKNCPGAEADSPASARHALISFHLRLVTAAGGSFVDKDGRDLPLIHNNSQNWETPIVCEISPIVSYSGENLEQLVKGKKFTSPLLLKNSKELNDHKNNFNSDLIILTKENSH